MGDPRCQGGVDNDANDWLGRCRLDDLDGGTLRRDSSCSAKAPVVLTFGGSPPSFERAPIGTLRYTLASFALLRRASQTAVLLSTIAVRANETRCVTATADVPTQRLDVHQNLDGGAEDVRA